MQQSPFMTLAMLRRLKSMAISRSTLTESSPILRKNRRNLEAPCRNRSLLLFTKSSFPFHNLSRCRQQPRSTGSFCPMALPAHARENIRAQRQMARHWKQRDAERSRRDLSKDRPVKTVERGWPSSDAFAANGRRRSVADPLLQAAFIKFDQIEIRLNIVATLASRFVEELEQARLFCTGARVRDNHRRVPLFDCFGSISYTVFLDSVYV